MGFKFKFSYYRRALSFRGRTFILVVSVTVEHDSEFERHI
jgi:hypothetical protein